MEINTINKIITHELSSEMVEKIYINESYQNKPIHKIVENYEYVCMTDELVEPPDRYLCEFYDTENKLVSRSVYDKGICTMFQKWYNNGRIKESYKFTNANLEGSLIYRRWHRNGQLRQEINYKNWEIEGKMRKWHICGRLKSEINYVNGQKQGFYEEWYENFQLKKVVQYKDGLKDGVYEKFNSDGSRKEIGFYKGGLKHGKFTEFVYKNGIKKNVKFYKYDVLDKKISYTSYYQTDTPSDEHTPDKNESGWNCRLL